MKLKGFLDQVRDNNIEAKSICFPVVASECLIGRGAECNLRLGTSSQVWKLSGVDKYLLAYFFAVTGAFILRCQNGKQRWGWQVKVVDTSPPSQRPGQHCSMATQCLSELKRGWRMRTFLPSVGEDWVEGASRCRGGRCLFFLTMRCFNDAMFSNS